MMYTNTSIEINLIKRFLFIHYRFFVFIHYRFFKTNDVKEHSQFIIIIIIINIIIIIIIIIIIKFHIWLLRWLDWIF